MRSGPLDLILDSLLILVDHSDLNNFVFPLT